MERSRRTKAIGPVLTLTVLGAVLGGCGDLATPSRSYGGSDYYGGPGYYGSPYYGGYGRYGGYDRFYGPRRYYGGGGHVERAPAPRMESPSRDPMRGFWTGQTRPPAAGPSQDRLGQFWRGEIRPPR